MQLKKILAGIGAVVLAAVAAFWLLFPSLAKSYLEKELGQRKFADVLKDAEANNRAALSKLGKAEILVDVPASAVTGGLQEEIKAAVALLKPSGGWHVELEGSPTVSFHPHALRAIARLKLSNPDIATVVLDASVDAVPAIKGSELQITSTVSGASIHSAKAYGFRLPGAVTSLAQKAINESLDALSTGIPIQRTPLHLPPQLMAAAKASPAMLVGTGGIAGLLGAGTQSPAKTGGTYSDAFIKEAKDILPNYSIGQGVIAVRPAGTPFVEASNKARDESAAQNLQHFQASLLIDGSVPVEGVPADKFSKAILLAADAKWFSGEMKQVVLNALSKIKPDKIKLDVKPENVSVTMGEGLAEARASASALFADGKLKVDFEATAWAFLKPHPTGLEASYAIRQLRVTGVAVNWADRSTSLSIPYQDALGQVASLFIGELPKSLLVVPTVPIKADVGKDKKFKLSTKVPAVDIAFIGRAAVISPKRVVVVAVPTLDNPPPFPPTMPVAAGQLQRLLGLADRAYNEVVGIAQRDSLALNVPKPVLAALLETAWKRFDPVLNASHHDEDTFDPDEIKLIPGDASCGSACQRIEQCGDIAHCKIDVCRDVVAGQVCNTFCPGGPLNPLCRLVCKPITNRICGKEDDRGCLDRVGACISNTTECAARWTSGFQPICEAALSVIKKNDAGGLAKVSGGTKIDASGTTLGGSALKVSPKLDALEVGLTAGGSARVDAYLDIRFTDFGNLLLCPSGRLSGKFDFTAGLGSTPLRSNIGWTKVEKGLRASLRFGEAAVNIAAKEPPLVSLVTQNPALLSCSLGQAVVGLSVIAFPRITRDLVADLLRKTLGKKNGPIAGAIIDGRYTYKGDVPEVHLDISAREIKLFGKNMALEPRMEPKAIVVGYSGSK